MHAHRRVCMRTMKTHLHATKNASTKPRSILVCTPRCWREEAFREGSFQNLLADPQTDKETKQHAALHLFIAKCCVAEGNIQSSCTKTPRSRQHKVAFPPLPAHPRASLLLDLDNFLELFHVEALCNARWRKETGPISVRHASSRFKKDQQRPF